MQVQQSAPVERLPPEQMVIVLREAVGLVADGLEDLERRIGARPSQRLLLGPAEDVHLLVAFGQ